MEKLILQAEILWPAFLAGLLVLATHVPLGREVLKRGIIFLDLAIAQIAAFGVVLTNTIWLGENTSGGYQTMVAIIAAIAGSMGLYSLRKLEVKVQEAIIGILFILAATGSILVLAADPHGGERLKAILIGQILWLQPQELLPLAMTYAVVLVTWMCLKTKFGNWLFYPLFAVTITLSTQFVGVYLVFASLIIPTLATLHHSHGLAKGLVIGAIGYFSGLFIAALLDLPAGATVVWSLAAVATIYHGVVLLRQKQQSSTPETCS